jgi:formylglycine-generating enzyme required for sulfatase activity
MSRAFVSLCMLSAIGLLACRREADPRPQWLVTIATDAPVPQFGERLLVEILGPEGAEPLRGCNGCRRQFGVGERSAWPVVFAVVPEQQVALRLRARLFRTRDVAPDGLPGSDGQVDVVASLPPRTPTAIEQLALELPMACFGATASPAEHLTCVRNADEPLAREPVLEPRMGYQPLHPGDWQPASISPCSGEIPEDMVCIPGGAFLFGSFEKLPLPPSAAVGPERMVALGPFAIDKDELTVGRLRAMVGSLSSQPLTKHADPSDPRHYCTYLGPQDGTNDLLPVNCVSQPLAAQVCAVQGKRLLTEAEWEYAAGNTTSETQYPWGDDPDTCRHAVVGRAPFDQLVGSSVSDCRVVDGAVLAIGPIVGRHPRDVTKLGVYNLGGNLAEWVADRFVPRGSGCWAANKLYLAPTCSDGGNFVTKGGDWSGMGLWSRSVFRDAAGGPIVRVGIRCARSMPSAKN